MPGVNVDKTSELFTRSQYFDLERVPGLTNTGHLVDIGEASEWNGRKVNPQNAYLVQQRKMMIDFIQTQEHEVNHFNKSMGLPLDKRIVSNATTLNSFSRLYFALGHIVNSEAFSYYRAIDKIDTFFSNLPDSNEKINKACQDIRDAIQSAIKMVPDEIKKKLLAEIMAHVGEKLNSASLTEPDLKLINMLGGIQKDLHDAQTRATNTQKMTSKPHAAPEKNTSETAGKQTVGQSASPPKPTPRKPRQSTPPPPKPTPRKPRQSTPPQPLTKKNTVAFDAGKQKQNELPGKQTVGQSTPPAKPASRKKAIPILQQPLGLEKTKAVGTDKQKQHEVPENKEKATSRKKQGTSTTVEAKAAPAHPSTTPATKNQTPSATTSKSQAASDSPVQQTPQAISLNQFKALQRNAYSGIHLLNTSHMGSAQATVDAFIKAIHETDYQAGSPEDLKKFIERNKEILQIKMNNKSYSEKQKEMHAQMQNVIKALEEKASPWLKQAGLIEAPEPTDANVKKENIARFSAPERVKNGVAPGLYNYGNTCFFNSYTNHLMLSLSPQEIKALQSLDANTPYLAATGLYEKLSPSALQVRDCIIEFWQAYHENPPRKDLPALQHKFLSACAACGNARRNGDKNIPEFFARCFPENIDFSRINQEDVTELQVAMNDLLLSKILENEHVSLHKTKATTVEGKDISLFMKAEAKTDGIDARVMEMSGNLRQSVKECLSEYNSDFIAENLEWAPEQLEKCGIHGKKDPQRFDSKVENKLVVGSDTQKLTVKIQPFDFFDKAVKYSREAVGIFEKDGNPLEITLTNPQTKKPVKAKFLPRSIVCHQGNSPSSGHYYTISFQENGKIMMHNDSEVTELSAYAKKQGYPEHINVADFLRRQGASPYMIDYRRVD